VTQGLHLIKFCKYNYIQTFDVENIWQEQKDAIWFYERNVAILEINEEKNHNAENVHVGGQKSLVTPVQ